MSKTNTAWLNGFMIEDELACAFNCNSGCNESIFPVELHVCCTKTCVSQYIVIGTGR